jgi:DNA-binding HxlR family transcriptional regulator
MSPSVLNARLKDLREARLVELVPAGYQLTPAGAELIKLLQPLNRWAERWATDAPSII